MPSERSIVTTAGRPVGIAAIARLMPTTNRLSKSCPRASPSATIATSAIAAMTVMITVIRSSCLVSGVLSCSTPLSIPEMRPTSVVMPVAVTTISPRPRVTCEFMYAMSRRSPSGTSSPGTAATPLATGALSPVSPDSSISSAAVTSSRPSAGTLSPASKPTTSPGTSSSAGTICCWPSRRTFAFMTSICRSAATLSAALPSWCSPMSALNTVSASTTTPVVTSPSAMMLTTAAPTRTSCMRSLYWRRNACHPGSLRSSASAFGP